MNLKKKIIPIICALGLTAAYPTIGLGNKTDDIYKDVEKVKITHSYLKWFNDTGIVDEAKYSEVERTYKDGRISTETDIGVDGTIDYVIMKHVKVSNEHGCQTIVVEEDIGNDGRIDYRETHKQMLGGSRTEADYGADGKIDHVITEMLISRGNITEYSNSNGVTTYRETKSYLDDGSILTEHDVFADCEIDYITIEKVLSDGTKVTKYVSYDPSGGEKYDKRTEKTLPDGTKVTEFDMGDDGTVDQREREKVIKNSPNFTVRTYEVETRDGKVVYQDIEEILEFNIP